jgi:hypothetical protein
MRAMPLDLTVHALPELRPVGMDPRVAAGRRRLALIGLVCALPVIASCLTYFVWRPTGSSAYSTLIRPSVAMPDVVATRPDGTRVALRTLAGQWLLVVAHGTDCDAACEHALFLQRQLREMTGRDRDRIDKLWLVLDDAPAPRPIAAPLRAALEATPAMHILRLPRREVAAWLRPAPGQALESHLYIVDPQGEWMMRAPPQPDPARLKGDLERLLHASAGWDRPGRDAPQASR